MKYTALFAMTLFLAGCTAIPPNKISGSGDICSPQLNVDATKKTWVCGDASMSNISPLVYNEVTDAY